MLPDLAVTAAPEDSLCLACHKRETPADPTSPEPHQSNTRASMESTGLLGHPVPLRGCQNVLWHSCPRGTERFCPLSALLCPQDRRLLPAHGATDTDQSPHCFQVVYSTRLSGTGLTTHPGIHLSPARLDPPCPCCSQGSWSPGEGSSEAWMDTHSLPDPVPVPILQHPSPRPAGAGDCPGQGGCSLTSLTGGSTGSVPPLSRNLEKVSTSRVLLYSTIWSHGREGR